MRDRISEDSHHRCNLAWQVSATWKKMDPTRYPVSTLVITEILCLYGLTMLIIFRRMSCADEFSSIEFPNSDAADTGANSLLRNSSFERCGIRNTCCAHFDLNHGSHLTVLRPCSTASRRTSMRWGERCASASLTHATSFMQRSQKF